MKPKPSLYRQPEVRRDVAATVIAVSAPPQPGWRWRIVNAAGEGLRESAKSYPTITVALAEGQRQLATPRQRPSRAEPRLENHQL